MSSEVAARPTVAALEGDALNLRVLSMRRTLDLARAAMPLIKKLDPLLADRVAERFEKRIDQTSASLKNVGRENPTESKQELSAAEDLLEETLAFLTAAGARSLGLDQGNTTLALRWLDQLSSTLTLPRVAVIIPSVTEITGMMSSIIRLRVPSDSVWGLPVAAHEYAHFVAAHLIERQIVEAISRSVTPVEDILHRESTDAERPVLYTHGHELFADAFAAAVAGPAYTHYCIRYRFSPTMGPTATHPSPMRRVRVQLAVLNQVASTDPTYQLATEIATLQKRWNSILLKAGSSPLDNHVDPKLDQLESDLVALIFKNDTLERVVYRDHMSACALAEQKLQTEESFTVPHIINAAWRARTSIERNVTDPRQAELEIGIIAERAYFLLGKATQNE